LLRREQPFLLAGLGIAVGAALLPATEAKDRAMGETSDRLKQTAKASAIALVSLARNGE
jgi:hypothetical protein